MTALNALRQNLQTAVANLDTNRNGTLATQELSKSALSPEAKKVIAQAISRAANSAGGQSIPNVQAWTGRLVDEFASFDTDGSGTLTAEEISAAEPYRQQGQLRAMQKLIDAGGLSQPTPATRMFDHLRQTAAQLDVNGNGVLATQEISRSALSAEEKKVLAQATARAANSTGGQSVENVQRWLTTFEADVARFDANGDSTLSADEIASADPFRQQPQLRAAEALLVTWR